MAREKGYSWLVMSAMGWEWVFAPSIHLPKTAGQEVPIGAMFTTCLRRDPVPFARDSMRKITKNLKHILFFKMHFTANIL